jgi:crotonobetainyl-CoA:carnitine CoA-transferase CaiB-like acyl-CoA transferase
MIKPHAPYHGITVVEAVAPGAGRALRLAAAMAGRILADFGAAVTSYANADDDEPALRAFLSARKTVKPYDMATAVRAATSADILLIDDKGLESLSARTRPIIVGALSHLGGKARRSDVPASAFTISALGGLLNLIGDPARAPLKLAGHQEAYALGLSLFCGLSAALARDERQKTTVRANLLDTIVWLNWKAVPLSPTTEVPTRAGLDAEWQVLRCADGFAALVYQEPEWPRLLEAMAEPRLDDPRFTTRAGRLQHARDLAAIIESRFLTLTRRDLHALALKHRLPLGPVWSPAEAFDDPHNRARGFFEPLQGAMGPRLPLAWNGHPVQETFAVPQPMVAS